MIRKVHWVSRSKDSKTGEVPVSYSTVESCPNSCSLKKGGCYAWGLYYINSLGAKIGDGRIIPRSLKEASKKIRSSAKIARHRVAGDIVGDVKETVMECEQIEKMGLINIGYTHNWRDAEAQPLKSRFRASCQSMDELIEARKAGWATTLVVKKGVKRRVKLSNGETAFKCPARTKVVGKKDITCNSCTLCKVNDSTRDKTILFEVHGNNSTLSKAKSKVFEIKELQ